MLGNLIQLEFSLDDAVDGQPPTPANLRTPARRASRARVEVTSSEVDEQALASLWRKGREAWKDVKSATDWVGALRGGES
jgi:hypothetical protein